MALPSPEQASTWGGKVLVDRDGAPIGTVTQIYTDDATGLPEWATIKLGEATAFLPLLDAHEADGQVRVRVKRDEVAKAPMVVDRQRITEQEEGRLYEHYGIPYTPERSRSGLPVGVGPVHVPTVRERLDDPRLIGWGLAAAMTLAAAVVAVLGFRPRRPAGARERAGAAVASGAATVSSSAAARAAARSARKAARDALREAGDAAHASADTLDGTSSSRRARRRRRS